MKTALVAAIVLLASSASAHRLDEYLQGTLLSVEKNRVQAQMTLTPGVAIFPAWIASIDTDANGVISEKEQRTYAGQVLRDLSLTIDGHPLKLQLVSVRFSSVDEIKEGSGDIQLNFSADLPRGDRNRKLVLENHHLSRIAAYQVNCLVPSDPNIQIAAQERNYSQSVYQLDYIQADVRSYPASLGWLGAIPLLLFTRLAFLWRNKRLTQP